MDFSYYLMQYLSPSGLNAIAFVFIISFFVWEIPRTFRMLEKEWAKGLYPEHGRAIDIVIFLVGIAAFIFLNSNTKRIILFPYSPIYNIVISIAAIALPVVLIVRFAGRIFTRIDAGKEVSEGLGHTMLDLVHTIFLITFVLLALPSAALLFVLFL